jgi:hypothetical protein
VVRSWFIPGTYSIFLASALKMILFFFLVMVQIFIFPLMRYEYKLCDPRLVTTNSTISSAEQSCII